MGTKSLILLSIIAILTINNVRGNDIKVTTTTGTTTRPPTTRGPKVSTTFKPIDFAKAKDEIVNNIKKQYYILKNLTQEFQNIFANETKPLKGIYHDLTEKISWYFREPTDNETVHLDKILEKFVPFGAGEDDYVDTKEKMEEFCKDHNKHLDSLKSWLRRKFKSLVTQMSFNQIITNIDKQTEHLCQNATNKQDYVKYMQEFKKVNSKLIPAKEALLDAADFIKNSTYKVTKVGSLCCTYWDLMKQMNESVNDPKAIEFVVNLTKSYFSPATNFLCIFYPEGASICKEEEKSPKSSHKYKSIILQMVLTTSEIVAAK